MDWNRKGQYEGWEGRVGSVGIGRECEGWEGRFGSVGVGRVSRKGGLGVWE